MQTYNPGQKSWSIFAFVALFTTTHAPPLPRMQRWAHAPAFFLEGRRGEGRGEELSGICKKDSTVLIEGIVTLTFQGLYSMIVENGLGAYLRKRSHLDEYYNFPIN